MRKSFFLFVCLGFLVFLSDAYANQRFFDLGNGTVTDTRTGLIWLKNANPCGGTNWDTAMYYCNNLANGQAGLTDGSTAGQWRLPSLSEFQGIGSDPPTAWGVALSDYPPAYISWIMPGTPFVNVQPYMYWSSTGSIPAHSAFGIQLNGGVCHNYDTSGYYSNLAFNVWPVRAVIDIDGDGIIDTLDNCPSIYNPNQTDTDGDGIGDACDDNPDSDLDDDGIKDNVDNCPNVYNPDQADSDANGIGDRCDTEYLWTTLQQTKAALEECLNPTIVQLSFFEATPSNKQINLQWKTDSEIDNSGYNVWRADGFKKITSEMIPAKGSATEGAEYNFLDEVLFNRTPYVYLLEDVDSNGMSTFHGPVKAVPRAIYGTGK